MKVYEATLAPILENPIIDQTINGGEETIFTFPANTFSDPQGDTLSYTAKLVDGSNLPSWLVFDGQRKFTANPTNANVGSITIRVTADDGNGHTTDTTFVMTVLLGNEAPVISGSPAKINTFFEINGTQHPQLALGVLHCLR